MHPRKKEVEIFGIDMESKIELLPPRLMADTKQDLANTIVDVVALPGRYHGGNGRKWPGIIGGHDHDAGTCTPNSDDYRKFNEIQHTYPCILWYKHT
jgi:hypothetical protein